MWSGPVLIDRGLDLSREAVLKERRRRAKLTESLTLNAQEHECKKVWHVKREKFKVGGESLSRFPRIEGTLRKILFMQLSGYEILKR